MTIKETAGKVLLYFYRLQRTVPSSMRYRQLVFMEKKDGGVSLTSDKKWLTKDLLDINPNPSDIFNAYIFLLEKGFIRPRERAATGARIYIGIQLSSRGIDIVEGVEQGSEGKDAFHRTFNIAVSDSSDIEAVVEENLSSLLG